MRLTLRSPTLDNHAVGSLVVASLEALGQLSPGRARMAASRGASLAASHRVVDGVHSDPPVVRSTAEPPRAACLTQRDVRVLYVRNLPNGAVAFQMNHAHFAGRQAHLRIVAIFRHERGRCTCSTNELGALSLLELDIVNHRAERYVP